MAGHLPTERAILEIVDAEFEHLNDMMEKFFVGHAVDINVGRGDGLSIRADVSRSVGVGIDAERVIFVHIFVLGVDVEGRQFIVFCQFLDLLLRALLN